MSPAFGAAKGRAAPIFAYGAIFVAALLVRGASVIRGDQMAWWDGVGWGYADLWIGAAAALAFHGSPAGLAFSLEGLVFVPFMAIFLKLFGLHAGLVAWEFALVVASASLASIAAMTVRTITGGLAGGVLAGILVVFDPVLSWFGLNGWSDASTFVAIGLSYLGFVSAMRRPTAGRLVCFGLPLAFLALGHATWTWPAVAWAALAWPLLTRRAIWVAEPLTAPRWPGRAARLWPGIPLLTLVSTLLAVNFALVGIGVSDRSSVFPVFSSDVGNQVNLAFYYGVDTSFEDWSPLVTVQTILTKFPRRLPEQVQTFVEGQMVSPMPLGGLLTGMVTVGLVAVALRNRAAGPGFLGLIGLPLMAGLALAIDRSMSAGVFAFLLILGLAWAYLPSARALIIVVLPFLGILLLWNNITAQFRHSNVMLYLFYLIAGLVLDTVWRKAPQGAAGGNSVAARLAGRAGPLSVGVALAVLVGAGVVQAAGAYRGRAEEERYLAWLGSVMPMRAVLLTTGNVDPWRVQELVGRKVLYDVENGGRLVVDGGPEVWKVDVIRAYPESSNNLELFGQIRREEGELWFYRPGETGAQPTFEPKLVPGDSPAQFGLMRRAVHPTLPLRGAYEVSMVGTVSPQ